MDRAELQRMVESGATIREIADAIGDTPWMARTVLREAGLETERMRTYRLNRGSRDTGQGELRRRCPVHGEATFRIDARGTYRCPQCNGERVRARRRRIKAILVADAGGACRLCGYDRCLAALEFHHLDPATKSFGLALRGHSRSLERARVEAAKCVLLCSNCHAEVEAGSAVIPLQ